MAVCTVNSLRPQLASRATCFSRVTGLRPLQARRVTSAVRCSSDNDSEQSILQKAGLPAAVLLSAALLFAGTPDEALAARSGGRVGGSSFRSAPRSAPSAGAIRSGGGATVRNYNYYSAPPLVSPYGFGMPFFGGGYGVGFFPMGGIGSLFNILIIMFILNIVLQTVRSFTNGGDNNNNKRDNDDDDRW